ncbi:MAG: hypothetical protein IJW48_00970 [Clostridia bacterium]|nr:hypothetical protein [Clostridia bacterium]
MNTPEIIKEFSGERLFDKLSPMARDVVLTNLNYMKEAFGENVEYERLFHQTLLAPETEEYLYSVPERPTYEWGSRPVLEAAVAEATRGCKTERERVLGLVAYIRDLKEKSHGYDYFYGGTEEELIKKGERFCERVARLMCALSEIAGIPARIIFHVSGGHLTNEVFIEDKWCYVDPRFGLFYLGEDGKLMSVTEITRNPEVIYNQPEWVYAYGSKEYTPEFMAKENHDMYLRPLEIQLYGTYSLKDAEKYGYHYEWRPSAAFKMPERDEAYKGYAKARRAYLDATM